MAEEKQNNVNEESPYVIDLIDEDGNTVPFEHLDTVQVDGDDYIICIPYDDEQEVVTEVALFKIDKDAAADLDRVLVIDEAERELTLSDERIEKAITQNGARLIILDPIQAYMGEKTDMNRANEVRPMFRRLADVAERTGCAVILIGHLNKAAGGQSAYRGLGSIDFRAAARSVLLIGRVKREPNVRVVIHDKSSLAPEGKPVAFCLDPETGFSWIGEYDITADELLSGAGGNTATKTEQAEKLILDLLANGKELASEDIVKAAAEAGISERTVQNAKRNMGGILGARRVGGQWYNFIKKKQPPEPAS